MRSALDFFPFHYAIIILGGQKVRALTLISGVLISWYSTDATLSSHKFKTSDFLWLSTKYRLRGAAHWAKSISVQSMHPALWTEKRMFMLSNPKP